MRQVRKFIQTIGLAVTLTMARTFGRYVHSIGGYEQADFAIYEWRGRRWCFPLTPLPPPTGETHG